MEIFSASFCTRFQLTYEPTGRFSLNQAYKITIPFPFSIPYRYQSNMASMRNFEPGVTAPLSIRYVGEAQNTYSFCWSYFL